MITNTYVSLREWFYPIGNTPAVNLLRDAIPYPTLSQEKQKIELLMETRATYSSHFFARMVHVSLLFLHKALIG